MKTPKQTIPGNVRAAVLNRDNHRCRYCGSTEGPFHMDHVYPESKGGETSARNLVTACRRCNVSKHDKVGLWPKPIGYWKRHTPLYILGLVNIGMQLIACSSLLFFVLYGYFSGSTFSDSPVIQIAVFVFVVSGCIAGLLTALYGQIEKCIGALDEE